MYEVKTTTRVPESRIDDLLVTAFEGGSNYWIDEVKVKNWPAGCRYASECLTKGSDLTIFHEDCQENNTISRADIVPALQKLHDEFPVAFQRVMEEQYDANDADLFMQFLALGEIVYG